MLSLLKVCGNLLMHEALVVFCPTENVIDQESFHLLDGDSIKELIPRVGLRIRFSNYHKIYMEVCTALSISWDRGSQSSCTNHMALIFYVNKN